MACAAQLAPHGSISVHATRVIRVYLAMRTNFLFSAAALGLVLHAQPPQTESAPLRFAAASLKANTSIRNGMGNKFDPGMARWTNTPLRNLVESAYGLRDYQAVGWPEWLRADKWDIDAKTEGPTNYTQKQQMLQTLIVERFGLKFHREMKDFPRVCAVDREEWFEASRGERGGSQIQSSWHRGSKRPD
jgi:hypothetical protein